MLETRFMLQPLAPCTQQPTWQYVLEPIQGSVLEIFPNGNAILSLSGHGLHKVIIHNNTVIVATGVHNIFINVLSLVNCGMSLLLVMVYLIIVSRILYLKL